MIEEWQAGHTPMVYKGSFKGESKQTWCNGRSSLLSGSQTHRRFLSSKDVKRSITLLMLPFHLLISRLSRNLPQVGIGEEEDTLLCTSSFWDIGCSVRGLNTKICHQLLKSCSGSPGIMKETWHLPFWLLKDWPKSWLSSAEKSSLLFKNKKISTLWAFF